MIKLKIFKAEFTESKVAFKKVAFLGKWLKPLSSTYKRIALTCPKCDFYMKKKVF